MGQLLPLHAETGAADLIEDGLDAGGIGLFRADLRHLRHARQLLLRRLGVAAVGEIFAAVRRHQAHALVDDRAGGVLPVRRAGEQDRGQFLGQQGPDFVQLIHFTLRFLAIQIKGSSATCRSLSQMLWLWIAGIRMDRTPAQLAPRTSV